LGIVVSAHWRATDARTLGVEFNLIGSNGVMIGSGDPTPFDGYALVALCLLAAALLLGCVLGPRWDSSTATFVRWGALCLTVAITSAVLMLTPTLSGAVGAGRLLTLWPTAITAVALFLVWSWRLGHF
jgi:hypothetical protein